MRSHSMEGSFPSRIDYIRDPGHILRGVSGRRTVSEERASEFQRRCNKLRDNRMKARTKREKTHHSTAEIQELRKENEERNKHLARIQESMASIKQELEQQRVLILNLREYNSFLKLELLKVTGRDIPDDFRPPEPDRAMTTLSQVNDQDYMQLSLRALSLEDVKPIERDTGSVMALDADKGNVEWNALEFGIDKRLHSY